MRSPGSALRTAAVALVVVLLVTLVAPARAEADVLTTIAIVSLVVAGVIVIAYLVVANLHDSRRGDRGAPVWVACAESDAAPRACWPLPDLPTARADDEARQGL